MYYDSEDFNIYKAQELPALFYYTRFWDLHIIYMLYRFTKQISFICIDSIVHLE